MYIPAKASTFVLLQKLATDKGLSFDTVTARPPGDTMKLKPVRIGLWDQYGGSIPSGWIRWLLEQFEFRELLYQMTARDLVLRYKQTAMGFGWALMMPLLNTAIFSIVFMSVAPVRTRVPYPLFAFCGLLVARYGYQAATGIWLPTCLAGWILGLVGTGIMYWQRAASRRGARGAQRMS